MEFDGDESDMESWCDEELGLEPEQEATSDEYWSEEDYGEELDQGELERGPPDCYWPSLSRATLVEEPRAGLYEDSDSDDWVAYTKKPRHRSVRRKEPIPKPPSTADALISLQHTLRDLNDRLDRIESTTIGQRVERSSSDHRGRNRGIPTWSPSAPTRRQTPRHEYYEPLSTPASRSRRQSAYVEQPSRTYARSSQYRAPVPMPAPRTSHNSTPAERSRTYAPLVQFREPPARYKEPFQEEGSAATISRSHVPPVQHRELPTLCKEPAKGGVRAEDKPNLVAPRTSIEHHADQDRLDAQSPPSGKDVEQESSFGKRDKSLGEAKEESGRVFNAITDECLIMESFKQAEPPKMATERSVHPVILLTTTSSTLQLGVAKTEPSLSTFSAKTFTAQGHMAMHLINFGADQNYVWHPGERLQPTAAYEGIKTPFTASLIRGVLSFTLKALLFSFDPGNKPRMNL
ncbi:PREDICTED: serine/arginine repetitive matrix protein 1-like [Camelina sativa]|uniref:Serine/arginine repetitive matrix protein 1-like n=1 Tax=Camelina sativa TaxID=90675 RepID=A0ABM0TT65_CAMSA|nr:PREDICTED: serine/arginine repetitive matrix protein 1-like [Camelina sativa]